jgi:hypothetical protein
MAKQINSYMVRLDEKLGGEGGPKDPIECLSCCNPFRRTSKEPIAHYLSFLFGTKVFTIHYVSLPCT